MENGGGQAVLLVVALAVLGWLLSRRRWEPSKTAHGTARWATDAALRAARMLGGAGLVLGRTAAGELIRLADYCHVLLVGSTGSGKGVSVIVPNLLTYRRGSVVCFDTKKDLHAVTADRRAAWGERIVELDPFDLGGGGARWNPLDTIPSGSPLLVDSARATSEALVFREGTESDPHWNDKAVQVICAVLTLVLLRMTGTQRSLASVQEIACDLELLAGASEKLREAGGVPARFGGQLRALFETTHPPVLTKEGNGVMSTVARHLSFLDSEPVSAAVSESTFDPAWLLRPGTTLFLQIPPDQLEAQRGLLRCWVSTLARFVGSNGKEENGEVLFLIDEASALGQLPAVEEILVRGRWCGARLLLAYQSDSQVQDVFAGKKTLLYDNCATQIYLGASSFETAERLSKSLGDWTQVVTGAGENESRSWQEGGAGNDRGAQRSVGGSLSHSVAARALLQPSEVLRLNPDYLIAFHRGTDPILARRVKYFSDPAFTPGARRPAPPPPWWWALLAAAVGLAAWAILGR